MVNNPACRTEDYEDRSVRRPSHRRRNRVPWTCLDQATDPLQVLPGPVLIVGAGSVVAFAEVIDVAPDGLVRVKPVPGPVKERRLAEISQRA